MPEWMGEFKSPLRHNLDRVFPGQIQLSAVASQPVVAAAGLA